MEYQVIKENGKDKFVVLSIEHFEQLIAKLEDVADLEEIRASGEECLYDQEEAEEYIFMNPVKRERLDRGWTQRELADRIGVKQSTVAKWEQPGAVYRRATQKKLANVFEVNESVFS